MPTHIFDIDEATAERLTRRIIRRRRMRTVGIALLAAIAALATMAAAL